MVCFDIICSSSLLLMPRERGASWLWRFRPTVTRHSRPERRKDVEKSLNKPVFTTGNDIVQAKNFNRGAASFPAQNQAKQLFAVVVFFFFARLLCARYRFMQEWWGGGGGFMRFDGRPHPTQNFIFMGNLSKFDIFLDTVFSQIVAALKSLQYTVLTI